MSSVSVAPGDNVHLGKDHWHRDRSGMAVCVQIYWQFGGEPDVVTREEAERVGYEPCSRCVGGA